MCIITCSNLGPTAQSIVSLTKFSIKNLSSLLVHIKSSVQKCFAKNVRKVFSEKLPNMASFYTPGIYAAGYIVFALTFVRSSVRMFVR